MLAILIRYTVIGEHYPRKNIIVNPLSVQECFDRVTDVFAGEEIIFHGFKFIDTCSSDNASLLEMFTL